MVSEADKNAEENIKRTLGNRFPGFAFLCEESGASSEGSSWEWRFIVDPLDGTTSFLHRHPHWSVSIACERRGHGVVCGVVYNPTRDEMFTAIKGGGGSLCNGRRIGCSGTKDMIQALICTGFPTTRAQAKNAVQTNFPFFEAMLMKARDVRRNGSAALDLCYVACGRMDLYWELGLKAWDVAAGGLVLAEAGGSYTDMLGKPFSYEAAIADERFNILGSNGGLHQATLETLQQVRKERGANEWE